MLAFLTAALYGAGVGNFLVFDSHAGLSNNPYLDLDGASSFVDWLLAIQSFNAGPGGRPVSMLSFALNAAMFDNNLAAYYKIGNLLIHLLTGLVAVVFLETLLRASPRIELPDDTRKKLVLTAIAIWMLHPLQLTSVLYAIQRMEQLSALFTLCGLLVYVSYRRDWLDAPPQTKSLSNGVFWLGLFLLLAFFSKEDGILLLPLVLLIELIFFGAHVAGRSHNHIVVCGWGLLFAGLMSLVLLTAWSPNWLVDAYSHRDFGLQERVLTQLGLLWQYQFWFVLPDIRQMGIHHDDIALWGSLSESPAATAALLGWAVALIASAVSIRKGRWMPLFALAWFLICHLLESTLLPLEMAYEHRNYLAVLSLALAVAWLIWLGLPALTGKQRSAMTALILVLLAFQLWSRASIWQDEERLAAYHVFYHPQSVRSNDHFANLQLRLAQQTGDASQAAERLKISRQYYVRMLALEPDNLAALASLFYLDERYFSSQERQRWLGGLAQADRDSSVSETGRRALELVVQCVLGKVCALSQQEMAAIFTPLLRRFPEDPDFTFLYAVYLGEGLGRYQEAQQLLDDILQNDPAFAQAMIAQATWYDRFGEHGKSWQSLRELLLQTPRLKSQQMLLSSFGRDS